MQIPGTETNPLLTPGLVDSLSRCDDETIDTIYQELYPNLDAIDRTFQHGIDLKRAHRQLQKDFPTLYPTPPEPCCSENYMTGSCPHSQARAVRGHK